MRSSNAAERRMTLSLREKENNVKPLIKIEWVPIILSMLALALSLVTFYFQFFHVSESITAAGINMDFAKNQKSGPMVLNIALVDRGNRDALIPGCTLTSDRITFDLEHPAEAQMTLKPGEVKPRVLRGTFTFNQSAPNGVAPIITYLSHLRNCWRARLRPQAPTADRHSRY
jgi:hypothetical protein